MQITLNGEAFVLADAISVAALIEHMQLTGKRIAVEVNEDIVPRGMHATHILHAGDRVEIVHAIGGG